MAEALCDGAQGVLADPDRPSGLSPTQGVTVIFQTPPCDPYEGCLTAGQLLVLPVVVGGGSAEANVSSRSSATLKTPTYPEPLAKRSGPL